jgi:hypothetical protein
MFFNRYVIGFLFAAGLVVLILVLAFSGPSKPKTIPKPLVSYADSSSYVEAYIYGAVVASQNHNEVSITVNQYDANLTVYQGYDHKAVNAKTYNNSLNGYKAFLAALNLAGYTNGNTNPKAASSLGYCAIGDVYTFKLVNNGQTVSSFWATNCSSDPITYLGNLNRTLNLFQAQIPDYGALTSSVSI